jgi:tetratricopeptide (TPR) repeat protein
MPRPIVGPCRLLALVACCAAWAANVRAEERPASERARELMNHSHWKQARAVVEAGLREHPDDPALLSAMADVHATFGELEEAQAVGERAVRLAPHDAQAHESLAEVYGERASRSGPIRALSYAGKFRRQAEAAIADQPDRLEARYILMVFYLQAPRIAGGDHRKALSYAGEIAGIDSAMGELARAEVAVQTHDTAGVEADYRRAVEMAPRSVRARMALANWAAAPWRGQWELAEHQARAACEAEPDRSAPYALLAWLYAHLGRWATLDSLLAEADARCPDDRNPWYQAGRALLADDREPERAERCFRRYLEIEAEPRAPDLAHGHWRLAQALEKQNRRDEAVAELRESLRLAPGFDLARRDLKRLKG